jgi:predicted nucleotidyltransferase
MATLQVSISRESLASFCVKHHIRKLSLFGSVLRDDFRPDSDVDVLVEFEVGFEPRRLQEFLIMENELKQIFGREVDLGDAQSVIEDPNYIRRNRILNSAQVIYEG